MFPFMMSLFATMLIVLLNLQQPNLQSQQQMTAADVIAANFWSYQQSVGAYVFSHPTASGVIPDANLTFQEGYIRGPQWTNTVSNGVLYTYSTAVLQPGVINAIGRRGGMAMIIGTASAGTMTSLTNAATG